MMWYRTIYLFLCIGLAMQAPICRPTIKEGKTVQPEIGGFISLECEVSSCMNPNNIVFEKAARNATWTPMFEAVNQTYHRVLGTTADYTLKNRTDYYAFATFVHSLYIIPLVLEDHGEWRCVVCDGTGKEYTSGLLNLNVYVPPADKNVHISPKHSYLVIGQVQEFTCITHGIHPEPEVLWKVNGLEHKGNTITKQREDQLWDVTNTIRLKVDTIGINILNCIMRTNDRDPWMLKHINITVQESATVIYPQHDKTQTVDVYSTFSISCVGSGYYPHITWNHDGEQIPTNDTRYIIQEECDNLKCEGSITSKPMDSALACEDKEYYSGVYTCEITLNLPYNSSEASSNVNLTISKTHCKEEDLVPAAAFSILSVVFVVVIMSSIILLVRSKIRRKRQNMESAGVPLLQLQQELEPITPTYTTKNWLKMCGQSRDYDHVVVFEYGSKRVFMHDISDLTNYTEHRCTVDIYAIIRISDDRFVVTEFVTHNIHLVQFSNEEFRILNTMAHENGCSRTLICAGHDSSFIKCEISGDDLRHNVIIYHVSSNDDALTPQLLTPERVTITGEPWRVCLSWSKTVLVIAALSGKIFTVDLENPSEATPDDSLVEFILAGVRSIYIDIHDNVFIGDRGCIIHKYTPAKQHSMMTLDEPVRGLTVINGRLIVCCGKDGKQQHIKVFSSEQLQT